MQPKWLHLGASFVYSSIKSRGHTKVVQTGVIEITPYGFCFFVGNLHHPVMMRLGPLHSLLLMTLCANRTSVLHPW